MDYDDERSVYARRKGNGCLTAFLNIGCGFILGVVCTIAFSGASYFFSAIKVVENNPEDEMQGIYYNVKDGVQYFTVRSKKGKAVIHTGMAKDSVVLLLGEPTEFNLSDHVDEITYRFGNLDMNTLHIEFEEGKVKRASQQRL